MMVKYFLSLMLDLSRPTVLHEIGFFCEQTRCFWYSSTHRTVSHRQLFCHFVTNSWLLQNLTQTLHLSPCVCVCESGGASERVKCTASGSKTTSYYFFSLVEPWISITEVIKSNENKRKRKRLTETLVCAGKAKILINVWETLNF